MRRKDKRKERRTGRGAGRASGNGGGDSPYRMREKLVSIGDDFWIENDQGQKVYKVDGKALRVRNTVKFEDANGNGDPHDGYDTHPGIGAGDKVLEYRDTYERRPIVDAITSVAGNAPALPERSRGPR